MTRHGSIVKRLIRVGLSLVATFILAVSAGIATSSIVDWMQPSATTVRWDVTAGTPIPPRFRIAMYPKNAEVTLHTAPDGPVSGTLNRAVLNSWEEVQVGGWICVGVQGGDAFVKAADLTFLPPADSSVDWIGNLQSAITRGEMRGVQYLYSANVRESEGPAGSRRVTLRISWSNSADNFVADVTPTTVIPVQWTLEQAFKEFARGMPSLLLGAIAFFTTLVIGMLLIDRYEYRRRARV